MEVRRAGQTSAHRSGVRESCRTGSSHAIARGFPARRIAGLPSSEIGFAGGGGCLSSRTFRSELYCTRWAGLKGQRAEGRGQRAEGKNKRAESISALCPHPSALCAKGRV